MVQRDSQTDQQKQRHDSDGDQSPPVAETNFPGMARVRLHDPLYSTRNKPIPLARLPAGVRCCRQTRLRSVKLTTGQHQGFLGDTARIAATTAAEGPVFVR
jgi:hypothetical protein